MKKANKTLQKECIQPLLEWYRSNARDLPWRRISDPYAIWVSEIMLQQTQVATVIPYWERWMKELPTISALASAPVDHILKLWEGLGYYRRVRLMQKAAIFIQKEHDGTFPDHDEAILALPGIGPYTAGAITSIAFDRPSPILDGNVIRVLTRYYGIKENPKSADCLSRLWELSHTWVDQADRLRPRASHNCSHLNQSMMELGARICLPNQNAKCEKCPIRGNCEARKKKIVETLPNLPKRRSVIQRHRMVTVLKHEGNYLIQRQMASEHNEGLYEFFSKALKDTHSGKLTLTAAVLELKNSGVECNDLKPLAIIKHTITHHRITLHCFIGNIQIKPNFEMAGLKWTSKIELEKAPMPSAHQKIRSSILDINTD